MEVLLSLVSAFIAALGGTVLASDLIRKVISYKILGRKPPQSTYSHRLAELTASLTKASEEVDTLLREMKQVAEEREGSVRKLEVGLAELETKEKALKEQIDLLENVPLPAAEYFAKLVEPGERRGARRDYLLFISGVIVTTIVAISLQAFG